MSREIERKFLVNKLPNISQLEATEYERYFLFIDENSEIRIQRKGDNYELERKVTRSSLKAEKQKLKISQREYDILKQSCEKNISRISYTISNSPKISIKIYSGDFKWLSRVKIEFQSESEALDFVPDKWFWKEITHSPLWRDSTLVKLNKAEFLKLIN